MDRQSRPPHFTAPVSPPLESGLALRLALTNKMGRSGVDLVPGAKPQLPLAPLGLLRPEDRTTGGLLPGCDSTQEPKQREDGQGRAEATSPRHQRKRSTSAKDAGRLGDRVVGPKGRSLLIAIFY